MFRPLPKPVITRAIINWIRPNEVACKILPMIIMELPVSYGQLASVVERGMYNVVFATIGTDEKGYECAECAAEVV